MTSTMLRFLLATSTLSDDELAELATMLELATSTLSDDELAELATMLEIAVEDERDDIRVVEDDVRSQPADLPIDRLAEAYIDAAGQLEAIKLRTAMAKKLLPAWSAS